jgi:hypothetical protein
MRLRSKSILRRWSMTSDWNFSALLTISSSIQSVRCSSSRVRINELAIVILESFKTHTPRFRRAFRRRLRRMFNIPDLKSSSVQSAKSSLNCSHSVSSLKSSRSYEIIVACTKMFLSTLRMRAWATSGSGLYLSDLIAMRSDEPGSER